MKKTAFIFYSIIVCCINANSQNLVPNPSFENYVQCPFSPIYCPFVNNGQQPTVSSWFSAISTTSDYYHNCAVNTQYYIPNNPFYGLMPARTGDGYVGIVAYGEFNGGSPQNSYREYVECKLNQALITGVTYNLTMWVRSFYRLELQPMVNFNTLTSLEASFTVNPLTNIISPISAPSIQLQKNIGGFITDTNWVQISGSYTATGGEEYLTIGTFNDPSNTRPSMQHIFPNPAYSTTELSCYYMIDDVKLVEEGVCDTIIDSHNLSFCSEEELQLSSSNTSDVYIWNTGAASSGISITIPGTYWRIGTDGCDAFIDTFHVRGHNDTISTHNTIDILCRGATEVILESNSKDANSYIWSTQENIPVITISTGGEYICMAEKDCILYIDTFEVVGPKTYTQRHTLEACFPHELKLLQNNTDSIKWNNGERTNSITLFTSGIYSYKAFKDCSIYIDSFIVTNKAKIEAIDLGYDVLDCKDKETIIGKEFSYISYYMWSTGEANPFIKPTESGTYTLTIYNGCREVSDSIKVEKVRCNNCTFLPNAFTPNNDGKNDFLKAVVSCPLGSFQLSIYNRFGERVYTSWNFLDKWDGKYKGVSVDMGVYYYVLNYTTLGDSKKHIFKGDVTVIY